MELISLARGLVPHMRFIVITGNPDSPLAHEADICLFTGNPKEVCPLGLTPTTSTTVMTVIGDILVVSTPSGTTAVTLARKAASNPRTNNSKRPTKTANV